MREKYNIFFQKIITSRDTIFPVADSKDLENADIARHITSSTKSLTEAQIKDLVKALNGEPVPQEWGEVAGSQLEIYTIDGSVQVVIPIEEFQYTILKSCSQNGLLLLLNNCSMLNKTIRFEPSHTCAKYAALESGQNTCALQLKLLKSQP